MRKFFRRKEWLSQDARIGIEGFASAWVIQSWLHGWGVPKSAMWWTHLVLQSVVVLTMFALALTKPRHTPTFDEQLKEYLKRHDYTLAAREVMADPTQFRFTEKLPDPRPSFPVCTKAWGSEHDCPLNYPGHHCVRNRAHVIGPDSHCLCACGKSDEYKPDVTDDGS